MNVHRRHLMLLAGAALALAAAPRAPGAAAPPPTVELWKNRACGCCTAWARHLEREGFAVRVNDVDDTGPVRAAAGVPDDLAGCHTAKVGGYVVEGHVPAAAVQRLLEERPAVLGLAVPGMPIGSPGMEVRGEAGEPFDVVAFAADGNRSVFMSVRP